MRAALKDAGIKPEEVGYVNAHATATPAGDGNESQAIEAVFGEHALSHTLKVSGTKSMHGHLLGGAGGLEAGICVMALQHQMLRQPSIWKTLTPFAAWTMCPTRPLPTASTSPCRIPWLRRHQRHAHPAALEGIEQPLASSL